MGEFLERKATVRVIRQDIKKENNALSVTNVDTKVFEYSSILKDNSPGFRIKFNVLANTAKTMNPCSIFIYNLAKDSRARFENLNSRVILSAGYGNEEQVIFQGNISRTRTRKEGPDYITQIEAKDGLVAFEGSTINQSFGQPTSVTDIVKTLVGSFSGANIGVPDVDSLDIPSKSYQSGVVLSGKSIELLDNILKGVDMEVTMEKEKLVISKKGSSTGNTAFVLSTDTGMVGIPEVGADSITVSSLLNARIVPRDNIIIRSRFVNGVYRIVRVEHIGDTFQGDYITKIETDRSKTDAQTVGN